MKIEISEEQAQWIRLGLQCYRDTCQVPASYGSMEFIAKVQQINGAIEWFDEELANAKFWEKNKDPMSDKSRLADEARKAAEDFDNLKERVQVILHKLVSVWDETPNLKALARHLADFQDLPATPVPVKAAEPVEEPSEPLCMTCKTPIRWLENNNGGMVWVHRKLPSTEWKHKPKPSMKEIKRVCRIIINPDGSSTEIQYRNDHTEMIDTLKEICALVEEWEESSYSTHDAFKLSHNVRDLLKEKGYME